MLSYRIGNYELVVNRGVSLCDVSSTPIGVSIKTKTSIKLISETSAQNSTSFK